jgi:hypothetical protein
VSIDVLRWLFEHDPTTLRELHAGLTPHYQQDSIEAAIHELLRFGIPPYKSIGLNAKPKRCGQFFGELSRGGRGPVLHCQTSNAWPILDLLIAIQECSAKTVGQNLFTGIKVLSSC